MCVCVWIYVWCLVFGFICIKLWIRDSDLIIKVMEESGNDVNIVFRNKILKKNNKNIKNK